MAAIPAITVDPEIHSGVPCFTGTRVPVRSLFDALKHGRSIEYFLEQFPSVKKQQVDEVLDRASDFLTTTGHAA